MKINTYQEALALADKQVKKVVASFQARGYYENMGWKERRELSDMLNDFRDNHYSEAHRVEQYFDKIVEAL